MDAAMLALRIVMAWTLVAVSTVVVSVQEPHRSPNHPLNVPVTDAEVREALRSESRVHRELTVRRAALLPPHTLSDATLRALSKEVVSLMQDVQKRFRDDRLNVTESNSNSDYIVSLSEALIQQQNPAGIDGLAAVVHMGRPLSALVDLGAPAIPALVRAAGRPEDEPGHAKAALDALTQILRRPSSSVSISADAISMVKAVASAWLTEARGDDDAYTMNEAVYLAVATGDGALRRTVASLVDNDQEFVRRGMGIEAQRMIMDGARKALVESSK